ncbi:hypothetical protein EBL_c11340 [Shimwellia blattae DSM 4481 = NBRC 105725]|uniref:Uncharacterized protein n=1 Tax=Shimwellia blattae (strain ATCC 29907 / DSM 4481 / JCM 1650 / NBRC 105725 / CDC 9005-74) TaxID=630626 RepID=I2B6T4_SHIBC|nr:hypothetical protein EBL_c11340 [Shimwellia blattae DSM 4481 = NBRC 105725]
MRCAWCATLSKIRRTEQPVISSTGGAACKTVRN